MGKEIDRQDTNEMYVFITWKPFLFEQKFTIKVKFSPFYDKHMYNYDFWIILIAFHEKFWWTIYENTYINTEAKIMAEYVVFRTKTNYTIQSVGELISVQVLCKPRSNK